MTKLTPFAALAAAALIGIFSKSAWSGEATSIPVWPDEPASTTVLPEQSAPTSSLPEQPVSTSALPAETTVNVSNPAVVQTPAPASAVVPGGYPPVNPGGYAQAWQQAPRWPVPQGYGRVPPYYPPGGHYRGFPAAPASAPAARENPLKAELQETQEQLSAKTSELDVAHSMLEQLRGTLQDSFTAEKVLSEKIAYTTREQQALQGHMTELTDTLNTANATLEQQHQLIDNHQTYIQQLTAERDQLHAELASRDEQLAALQFDLQSATQALAQARSRAGAAIEALGAVRVQVGAHRDALSKLEAELQHELSRVQGDVEILTEETE